MLELHCSTASQQRSERNHRSNSLAPAGAVTTLGRGGSDLTATVIGAALALEEVQVWKDVDGVLSHFESVAEQTPIMPHSTVKSPFPYFKITSSASCSRIGAKGD